MRLAYTSGIGRVVVASALLMIEITGVMPLPPANATIGTSVVAQHEEPRRAHHLDGVARRERVVHPVRHPPAGDALHRRREAVAHVRRARHRVAAHDGLAVDRRPERAELSRGVAKRLVERRAGCRGRTTACRRSRRRRRATAREWYSWSGSSICESPRPVPPMIMPSSFLQMAFPHTLGARPWPWGPETGAERWPVRAVPAALRERYVAEGWWTDDTLGERRRPVAPRRARRDGERLVGVATVARHLCRRPRRGAAPGHRARRRRARTGRRRRVPAAELARGGRRVLRARAWAATCSCRSCTSTATKRCASSSSRAAHGPTSRRTAFGHVDYLDIVDGAPRPTSSPDLRRCTSSSVRPRPPHRRACDASGGTPSTPRHPTGDRRRAIPTTCACSPTRPARRATPRA